MTTINAIPTNINQELESVRNIDRAKLEKTLKGTASNFKYGKENIPQQSYNHKKGWKNSRSFKGKNYSAHQRIEYIKERKRKQSENDKQLNLENPKRNIKAEPEQINKNNEKQVVSRGNNNFRSGGRRNRN